MGADMVTKASTYNCFLFLSHSDTSGHDLQGQPLKEKVFSGPDQIRDTGDFLCLCRPDTQGTADDHKHHHIVQCVEGVAVPSRTLSAGAVYISVLYFYFLNLYFLGAGSFLRVVMPLWCNA